MKARMNDSRGRARSASIAIVVWLHAMLGLPFSGMALAQTPQEQSGDRKVAVFVVPKKSSDAEAAKVLQTVLREAVNNLVGISAVGGVEMPDAVWAQQVGGLLEKGDALLNEDMIANPQAATDAKATFQEALAILEANPGAGDNRAWAHTFKGLAVACVLGGASNEGYKYMKTSLNLFPMQSAIEYGYSIPVQTMYERIIQDQSVEASGELELTSLPPHAEVRVDGKRRGFADPIRVSNLSAGTHRVTVHMDGYFIWESLVEIPVGGKASLVAELENGENWKAVSMNLKGIARKVNSPKKAEPFVQSLKRDTGVSEALIVKVGVTRAGLFALKGIQSGEGAGVGSVALEVARDGNFFEVLRQFVEMQFVSTTEIEGEGGALSMPASRAQDMLSMSPEEEALTLNPDAPMFETEEESDDLLSQWWFWTAIGVGVAGTAAAIAVPLALADDGDDGKGPTGAIQLNIEQLPR